MVPDFQRSQGPDFTSDTCGLPSSIEARLTVGPAAAVFGFVDPFDLVRYISDSFPAAVGRIENGLFVVERQALRVEVLMCSADHGSAALFLPTPAGRQDMDALAGLFEPAHPAWSDASPYWVEFADRGQGGSRELMGIVTKGFIGDARVFEELTPRSGRCCSDGEQP